jgi:predicted tellurium resistance membrane protein TerC
MEKPQSATSLESSPEEERKARLVKYTIAMSVRVLCLILGVFLEGWAMWVAFAGAIFLPYFAVIIANAPGKSTTSSKLTSPTKSISADKFKIVDED